uniref:Xylose isomerase n=1 Tax=Firmicutes bacterium enrichment culture clone fosmid MGS-M1 TaxID=1549348 RepID=A0A0B5KNE5_9FIRM|nr:xylose isomerase [Firmicutes bacterium enrichment culture clone fosmid MGS-M1]
MKVGVLTVPFSGQSLEDTLSYLSSLGLTTVEIGTGGYPGNAHANPEVLLQDETAFQEFVDTFKRYNMTISALSCHGNPVHPNKEIADKDHKDFENTVLLAEKLGIDTIITFSGCPGGSKKDKTPNWAVSSWPNDFQEVLAYQWNKVLIPYWKKAAAFAKSHGVTKIALEMHPGFNVYNPETLLKLRKAVGDIIGANFDPSHLFWQGIDPVQAIKYMGDSIHHFHAKDTQMFSDNVLKNGVLDMKSYGNLSERSWVFRTVGYGHDTKVWKDMMTMLRIVGYDGAISIEHEDSLMSIKEGLEKAVTFLQSLVIEEQPGAAWWF